MKTKDIEYLETIDNKLTRTGRSIDFNIVEFYLILGFYIARIWMEWDTDNSPDFFGLEAELYFPIVPIVSVFIFVRFGFVSLRAMRLIVERDLLIKEKAANNEERRTLTNIYRQSSFEEVFYEMLILDKKTRRARAGQSAVPFGLVAIVAPIAIVMIFGVGYHFFDAICAKSWVYVVLYSLGLLAIVWCSYEYNRKRNLIRERLK